MFWEAMCKSMTHVWEVNARGGQGQSRIGQQNSVCCRRLDQRRRSPCSSQVHTGGDVHAQWAMSSLAPGSIVHSDGLACFRAVATAGRTHEPVIVGGRKPKELPVFQRINTVLGNLTTSLWGSYHGFGFQKHASRYLGVFAYRFNRRFDLRTLHQRLLVAAVSCAPLPRRAIRMAEAHC